MGLFDFLHGVSNQKSEAEQYMEQRNKEYARKAAEYRRREALSTSAGGEFLNKVFGQSTTTPNHPRPVQPNQTQRPTTRTTSAQTCYTNPPTYPAHSQQCTSYPNIEKCDTTKSMYDSDKLDIFAIENAFVRQNTKTVTASGVVKRGGFAIGDKVVIKTTLEEREVQIQQIFRQGEAINYINISSGKVAIVLSNSADMLVRQGDVVTRKNKK